MFCYHSEDGIILNLFSAGHIFINMSHNAAIILKIIVLFNTVQNCVRFQNIYFQDRGYPELEFPTKETVI